MPAPSHDNDNDNQFDHDDHDEAKSTRDKRETLPEYEVEEHRITSPMARPEFEDNLSEEPELDEMPEDDGPDA
jgi:hypothetical protein